jgi:hypothetical protein
MDDKKSVGLNKEHQIEMFIVFDEFACNEYLLKPIKDSFKK